MIRWIMTLFFSIVLVTPSFDVVNARRGTSLEDDNLIEVSLIHDNTTRWFLEHRPESYSIDVGGSVVILLHGGTQSMRELFRRGNKGTRKWLEISDTNGILLIIPNGVNTETGDTYGDDQNWNDRRGIEGPSGYDDVGFISALAKWTISDRNADPARIYVTGGSNGGLMTYTLLIDTTFIFAAGAAFIANLPADPLLPIPNTTTPILIMNGNKDPLMPYDGGEVGGNQGGRGTVRSSIETRNYWIDANDADINSVETIELPNTNRLDGCRIVSEYYPPKISYSNSSNSNSNSTTGSSAPVQYYTMRGGGHSMPFVGRRTTFGMRLYERTIGGPICHEVDGASVAWEFLSQFALVV